MTGGSHSKFGHTTWSRVKMKYANCVGPTSSKVG